jgi:hypothetical protein
MRKHRSDLRLLVSLCAPLILLPLQAAPTMEWLSANGGGGVEYRWNIGLWHVCHTEFRDPAIAGSSRIAEVSGVIDYDRTTLNGIERNTIQGFNLRIYGSGTTVGPDVGCEQVNDVAIREMKRLSPPL